VGYARATVAPENPQISVVVSNLNGARYLTRLLDTLVKQRGVQTEIIVVDRHSTDASIDTLARYPDVRVISEPPESGLVAGYRAGAKHASHELLFFCNEDLYLDEGCLFELASRIDLPRRIAAADPWQWTYDGERWIHGGVRFRRSPWHIYSPYPRRMHEFTVPLPDRALIPFGCAGAVMMHAAVYEELGGWDASFFLDYEDTDLFLRAWQRNWLCVTVPSAHVFHDVGASNEQAVGAGQQTVSRRRYISHRVNVIVIAFKYFSPAAAPLGVLNWIATLTTNILLRRWHYARLDLSVLREVARRLPAVAAFRRRNRRWNRSMPGQRYFLDPRFRLEGGSAS
jgi:N-acetylglucosaminyl-diphospho-decaprenol L-rhamnosyltransferase